MSREGKKYKVNIYLVKNVQGEEAMLGKHLPTVKCPGSGSNTSKASSRFQRSRVGKQLVKHLPGFKFTGSGSKHLPGFKCTGSGSNSW